MARTIGLAALTGLAGCLNPATTRLPTLGMPPAAVERQSLGHFDPFPDPNLGPETGTRPPDFVEPRDPTRSAREGQLLRGAPAGPVAPGFSTGAYRDSDVVR
jgi:hypothetical protein